MKINNDSIPVGIESNSFNGFVNMSTNRKMANATLENLMKFLKASLSIWQNNIYVIEKYSTTVNSRNEYISEWKYLILNLLKTKSDIKE